MKMVKLTEDHYILVDDTSKEMYTIPTSQAKELLGVVDVHKKALTFTKEIGGTHEQGLAFIDGYYQALEDNKDKKWTDEDVIRIVEKSRITGLTAEYLLLTLQPQTEWEVEIVEGQLKLRS